MDRREHRQARVVDRAHVSSSAAALAGIATAIGHRAGERNRRSRSIGFACIAAVDWLPAAASCRVAMFCRAAGGESLSVGAARCEGDVMKREGGGAGEQLDTFIGNLRQRLSLLIYTRAAAVAFVLILVITCSAIVL